MAQRSDVNPCRGEQARAPIQNDGCFRQRHLRPTTPRALPSVARLVAAEAELYLAMALLGRASPSSILWPHMCVQSCGGTGLGDGNPAEPLRASHTRRARPHPPRISVALAIGNLDWTRGLVAHTHDTVTVKTLPSLPTPQTSRITRAVFACTCPN